MIWQGVTRQLRAEGHATRVLVTDYRREDTGPDRSAAAAEEADVHRSLHWYWREHEWPRLGGLERYAIERHNARVLERHLHDFRPDVVAWWPMGGLSLGLLEQVRRAGLPAVLFVLDFWPSYGPQVDQWTRMWYPRPRAAAAAERLTGLPTRLDLAHAGRWVFCSDSMRRSTLETGLAIEDWTIVQPGVETGLLDAPPEPEPPPWEWRLLYAGRVVRQKGVATAIRALGQLDAPEATLRVVGEGDPAYREELTALVHRLELRDRVTFEPPRPRSELVDLYRAADAVVFPVEWPEPWGLVPLEAMALGRPVVATGEGGSGDYLAHERNCLLFGRERPDELANALARLAGDPDLRERLRRGGRETAAAHTEADFNRRAAEEIEATLRRRSG